MHGTLQLESLLAAVAFVGVRVGSLMLIAPFFSSTLMPVRIRLGLAVLLTVAIFPLTAPLQTPLDMAGWTKLVLSESLVGLLLGMTTQVLFEAAQFAGQVIAIQLGLSLVNVLDPQSSIDTPVVSLFHQMIFLLLFFVMDVPEWLLRGLAHSFTYLPPGSASLTLAATGGLLRAAGGIWLVGVQIAAPVIVVTMITDVTLGLMGKISTQLPVLWIGISVKNVLGTLVLMGSLAAWPGFLERHFAAAIRQSEDLLHLAH